MKTRKEIEEHDKYLKLRAELDAKVCASQYQGSNTESLVILFGGFFVIVVIFILLELFI